MSKHDESTTTPIESADQIESAFEPITPSQLAKALGTVDAKGVRAAMRRIAAETGNDTPGSGGRWVIESAADCEAIVARIGARRVSNGRTVAFRSAKAD